MNWMLLLLLLPLAGAALVAFMPEKSARQVATLVTLLCCVPFLAMVGQFDWARSGVDQFQTTAVWFEPLGLSFRLAADSITMLLVGLTVLLGPICVVASYTAISERQKTYYAWLLVLQTAMTGVFLARDMVLFYVFFEFTLVPMFVLISLYGSTNRKYAAVKFFLYTFTGSILTLAGLAYVALEAARANGFWSFDFEALKTAARGMTFDQQKWVFIALMVGFAVKVPVFPFHTWLPLAHTEAPTAGSVVLAGVLLKLGTYGIFRFALQFTPVAAYEYAPALAVLGVVGIIYAGLICWVQSDIKKLVAYSSVSHLGFCVIGLFALNGVGLSGSVMYMINHGLSTGALFLLIGMIYERYHTREFKKLGGLASQMPVWSTFMVFFAMASVGLPGLNGFISEFMCLLGTFQAGGTTWTEFGMIPGRFGDASLLPGATFGNLGPWFAAFAAVGMVVTAIYILYMVGKIVWGEFKAPGHSAHAHNHAKGHGHDNHHGAAHADHAHGPLPRDLSGREIAVLVPLAVACLWLGLYPSPVLRTLEEPVAMVVTQVRADVLRNAQAALPADPQTADAHTPALLQQAATITEPGRR
ncbi:MAG: NADH-quinone oxidoreductase subunit M [Phycisphaeraceae bacterium]|nr:NADH-quinone oxidoreductase subunit M [Phycisphaeraceae bacterium]